MNQLKLSLPIRFPRSEIEDFCHRWKIQQFYLFGSVLGKDFNENSDIDVMIEFFPDHEWGWEIVTMNEELETIFNRRVDLLTKNGIENSKNWLRRGNILNSAVLVYEQK